MRARVLTLVLLVVSCGSRDPGPRATEPGRRADPPAPPPAPGPDARGQEPCITVDRAEPVVVEGTLARAGDGDLVLVLARARCVVGLPRAGYVREVHVASQTADLRPLVGAKVRLRGPAVGGTNEVGGPAVLLLSSDVERSAPPVNEE